MRFLKETKIDFLGMRRFGFVISGALILVGLLSLLLQGGPKLSIDFEGGTLVQIQFKEEVDLNQRLIPLPVIFEQRSSPTSRTLTSNSSSMTNGNLLCIAGHPI